MKYRFCLYFNLKQVAFFAYYYFELNIGPHKSVISWDGYYYEEKEKTINKWVSGCSAGPEPYPTEMDGQTQFQCQVQYTKIKLVHLKCYIIDLNAIAILDFFLLPLVELLLLIFGISSLLLFLIVSLQLRSYHSFSLLEATDGTSEVGACTADHTSI